MEIPRSVVDPLGTLEKLTETVDADTRKRIYGLALKSYKAGFEDDWERFKEVFDESYERGIFKNEEFDRETELRNIYHELRSWGDTERMFFDSGIKEDFRKMIKYLKRKIRK